MCHDYSIKINFTSYNHLLKGVFCLFGRLLFFNTCIISVESALLKRKKMILSVKIKIKETSDNKGIEHTRFNR